MDKENVIFTWIMLGIILAGIGLNVWIFNSALNGGFWHKYGVITIKIVVISSVSLYALFAIWQTIKYIRQSKKKGDNK